MDIKAVESSYARWAPVYDRTFGVITQAGRRRAVRHINSREGSVLEVGVGTGLSLRHYAPHLRVTGIDYSEEMLKKARAKVAELALENVEGLHRMDARDIDFPDDHFDTIAAMHVLSVVPDPERVMAEIARICKPGGQVVITNHFVRSEGILAFLERVSAPLANVIGWHSDFEIDTVLGREELQPEVHEPLPPLGMMTFLVLRKTAGPQVH
ncbi:phosphatidylethanolamine N-methyltransferase /phosphatidyl-N-methylethanolamine N-methyltransferase [Cribrihabitans marinus]|uniref:Phosphatidylethanolamine N-methyltransferase /phosphatidyl-N-methylethanolamine N-methyltransferase n=1 Tax=Cribrihabitans marinus TaxID=1227549 RepID=A0A1H7BS41_9RHOB|nr:methyltransferase domain-containing protein [Cribrihabitans marinus]GGH34453.1 SAM-dependent methyltransferase [Cribrihabitans marinus]SEJ77130.1 phosphatidylethanolamine N-methyltransferase /phosphatidyl-N-methylethanolamine N-methyltransferase [Cribrihabitans marinus]